jgi:hypothetical protein
MSPPTLPTDTSKLANELRATSLSEVSSRDDKGVEDGRQLPEDDGNVMASDGRKEPVSPLDGNQGTRNESQGPDSARNVIVEQSNDVGTAENGAPEAMDSSTVTLKPELNTPPKSPQHLSPDDQPYRDPTPRTPISSQPPSRSTSSAASKSVHPGTAERDTSPTRSDADFEEKCTASEDERDVDSRTEIQSIMDQFSEAGQGPGHEPLMSPRVEFASPLLGSSMQHPPRKSSLEPLDPDVVNALQSTLDSRIASSASPNLQGRNQSDGAPAVPPKTGSIHSFSPPRIQDDRYAENLKSPPLHRPPPEPEPEPDLPFDFHRFLEQLRHRTADPVAKFLRSFLQEFGKKQWMVHEQVKIISDFLSFITNKMAQCEVWRDVSDAEFDNAREGMEKLVMNRLYTQTFSPAILPPQPIPGSKPKRRGGERPMGPGRRGQHQEDVERDDILAQKVSIYGWVREEHLDIPAIGDSGKRFLILAEQGSIERFFKKLHRLTLTLELLKIKTYRAPRDKIICVLNCCKVIFGTLF